MDGWSRLRMQVMLNSFIRSGTYERKRISVLSIKAALRTHSGFLDGAINPFKLGLYGINCQCIKNKHFFN